MKTNKTIITLVERAEKRSEKDGFGIAHLNRKIKTHYYDEGVKTEVYRVEHERELNTYSVYHYDTLIGRIYNGETVKKFLYIYGESKSDAEALSTLAEHFGISKQFGFRPVNGGFYETDR